MKAKLFGAGSHLGVHVDGSAFGAERLIRALDPFDHLLLMQDLSIPKSLSASDHQKNLVPLSDFNSQLYRILCEQTDETVFPVLLGGDHSVAVPSALAGQSKHGQTGIIWIDAHTDYHTFESTLTGNIHGLPLAAITGYYCEELRCFHNGQTIDPANAVVVGARSVDSPEWINLRNAGVTVFTTEDILRRGPKIVMEEAFSIAGAGTTGIHISYDLDVIDPLFAPGVSVPEKNGISDAAAMQIMEFLCCRIHQIYSFDLVEYNPLRDPDGRTGSLALSLLSCLLRSVEKK